MTLTQAGYLVAGISAAVVLALMIFRAYNAGLTHAEHETESYQRMLSCGEYDAMPNGEAHDNAAAAHDAAYISQYPPLDEQETQDNAEAHAWPVIPVDNG